MQRELYQQSKWVLLDFWDRYSKNKITDNHAKICTKNCSRILLSHNFFKAFERTTESLNFLAFWLQISITSKMDEPVIDLLVDVEFSRNN